MSQTTFFQTKLYTLLPTIEYLRFKIPCEEGTYIQPHSLSLDYTVQCEGFPDDLRVASNVFSKLRYWVGGGPATEFFFTEPPQGRAYQEVWQNVMQDSVNPNQHHVSLRFPCPLTNDANTPFPIFGFNTDIKFEFEVVGNPTVSIVDARLLFRTKKKIEPVVW